MTKVKTTRKIWTDYDDKTLIDMRHKGVSIRIIAHVLQRTESSVNNRINVIGIGKKQINPAAKTVKPAAPKWWFARIFGW
mgnify:FL=1|tara:strand:+ start:278 stop:517 length:240 start_codon:yes stop_codon:yes gene_type:complete